MRRRIPGLAWLGALALCTAACTTEAPAPEVAETEGLPLESPIVEAAEVLCSDPGPLESIPLLDAPATDTPLRLELAPGEWRRLRPTSPAEGNEERFREIRLDQLGTDFTTTLLDANRRSGRNSGLPHRYPRPRELALDRPRPCG